MADSVRMTPPKNAGLGTRNTPTLPSNARYMYGGSVQFVDAHPDDVRDLEKLGFTRFVAPQRQEAPAPEIKSEADDSGDDFAAELVEAGLSASVADALIDAGFDNADALTNASDDDLLAVDGVGPATLEKVRAAYGK